MTLVEDVRGSDCTTTGLSLFSLHRLAVYVHCAYDSPEALNDFVATQVHCTTWRHARALSKFDDGRARGLPPPGRDGAHMNDGRHHRRPRFTGKTRATALVTGSVRYARTPARSPPFAQAPPPFLAGLLLCRCFPVFMSAAPRG
ncbi:hypothetical protein MTO96_010590 [Rhipicephalus appendiculatus]